MRRALFRCEAGLHRADDVLLGGRSDCFAAQIYKPQSVRELRRCWLRVRMAHTVQDRIGLRCSLHKAIHNVARVQAHVQESLRLLQQLASQRDDQTATVADLKRRLYQSGQCTGIGGRGWLPRSIAGSH